MNVAEFSRRIQAVDELEADLDAWYLAVHQKLEAAPVPGIVREIAQLQTREHHRLMTRLIEELRQVLAAVKPT
jgi:hypothetical protein